MYPPHGVATDISDLSPLINSTADLFLPQPQRLVLAHHSGRWMSLSHHRVEPHQVPNGEVAMHSVRPSFLPHRPSILPLTSNKSRVPSCGKEGGVFP